MSYLLDTHVLLWSLISPQKLPAAATQIITSSHDKKFISAISIWEISLKYATGKLNLHGYQPEDILEECIRIGYKGLSQNLPDFASFHRLPSILKHKDPFDRMLIWQAIRQDLVFLSHDRKMPGYKVHGLKLA